MTRQEFRAMVSQRAEEMKKSLDILVQWACEVENDGELEKGEEKNADWKERYKEERAKVVTLNQCLESAQREINDQSVNIRDAVSTLEDAESSLDNIETDTEEPGPEVEE